MWRDKDDLSGFYKAIRVLNYLNRLIFAKEENLRLVSDMTPVELSPAQSHKSMVKIEVPAEPVVEQVEVPVPIPHSPEFKFMVDTFKSHSINVIARGDGRMHNYYQGIFSNLNIDDMLSYTMPDVFDVVTDSEGRLPDPDQPR